MNDAPSLNSSLTPVPANHVVFAGDIVNTSPLFNES